MQKSRKENIMNYTNEEISNIDDMKWICCDVKWFIQVGKFSSVQGNYK